jgi:hypothetical protein
MQCDSIRNLNKYLNSSSELDRPLNLDHDLDERIAKCMAAHPITEEENAEAEHEGLSTIEFILNDQLYVLTDVSVDLKCEAEIGKT